MTNALQVSCVALLCSVALAAEPNAVTITTTKLEITDKTLEWCYRITNGSDRDIWLCEDSGPPAFDCEVYVPEGGQTLMIRREFDFELDNGDALSGRGSYIRLHAGRSRDESLSLPMPLSRRPGFHRAPFERDPVSVRHLVLEIGYYSGDLPEMILQACEESSLEAWHFGQKRRMAMLSFIATNEHPIDREMRIFTPGLPVNLQNGPVLRLEADTRPISYVGTQRDRAGQFRLPEDLIWCTRIEFRFQPSMLEYFFPNANEQALLSAAEIEYLKSQETLTIAERPQTRSVIDQIRGGYAGAVVTPGPSAQAVCYRKDERLTSLTLHGERRVDTEDNQRFGYDGSGLSLPRRLTPEIQSYEMRMQCARNLRNLWYRLGLYQRVLDAAPPRSAYAGEVVYPPPNSWCVDLFENFLQRYSMEDPREPYACPATGESKCHYAMNPNCRPDSVADMVLLFETKAGWNQHGGAELFTFDNHDPKGGCVLLNDGTVKFIRTEEELGALRWE